ncbi:UNVERIFIED_ORG: hypothetical protein E4P37_08250 [Bacillus sp. AZ43]
METAVAATARPRVEDAPFALRDVEDLHDGDLDGLLGDILDGVATSAHALGDRARQLAEG